VEPQVVQSDVVSATHTVTDDPRRLELKRLDGHMSSIASTIGPSSSDTAEALVRGDDMAQRHAVDANRTGEAAPEPQETRMNRIARRAHQIYEARSGLHGTAVEDWLTAERQIDAENDRAPENSD